MTEQEAAGFMAEVVRPAQCLILERQGASVLGLRERLLGVLQQVRQWPGVLSWTDDERVSTYADVRALISRAWPELGFYTAETGAAFTHDVPALIGDALDDLADIALEFENALHLAERDPAGGLSLLRFTADTHWGAHVEELARHLLWLSRTNES